MPLKYTPVTQSILRLIFLIYVRTKHRLNYGRQESERQLAVYDSDTPVPLKQGKGHQTWWYESVDPNKGYNVMSNWVRSGGTRLLSQNLEIIV